jgi:hypothetical protein
VELRRVREDCGIVTPTGRQSLKAPEVPPERIGRWTSGQTWKAVSAVTRLLLNLWARAMVLICTTMWLSLVVNIQVRSYMWEAYSGSFINWRGIVKIAVSLVDSSDFFSRHNWFQRYFYIGS